MERRLDGRLPGLRVIVFTRPSQSLIFSGTELRSDYPLTVARAARALVKHDRTRFPFPQRGAPSQKCYDKHGGGIKCKYEQNYNLKRHLLGSYDFVLNEI